MRARFKHIRVLCLSGGFIVAVAITISVFNLAPANPVSNGIRLSEILRDQRMWNKATGVGYEGFVDRYSIREQEEIHALHRIRESAWPVLLTELRAKDSKLKSWFIKAAMKAKWIWILRFIHLHTPPSVNRNFIATLAIQEMVLPPDERTKTQDRAWHGIEEFPASFRRKMVLDLAGVLQARLNDEVTAVTCCDLLRRIGTDSEAAIPALQSAARARVPMADYALQELGARLGRRLDVSLVSDPK